MVFFKISGRTKDTERCIVRNPLRYSDFYEKQIKSLPKKPAL